MVVTDGAAKFVSGLESKDFAVYEDGVKQDVTRQDVGGAAYRLHEGQGRHRRILWPAPIYTITLRSESIHPRRDGAFRKVTVRIADHPGAAPRTHSGYTAPRADRRAGAE